jgi:hypothetical protein
MFREESSMSSQRIGANLRGGSRVAVCADIDAPDRIAWGLSFRQLAVLSVTASALWTAYSRFGPFLPLAVWSSVGIVVMAVSVTLALGRRDGLPLEVWLRHGLALRAVPAVQVPGKKGTRALVETRPAPVAVAPLRTDAVRIHPCGTVSVDGTDRCLIACGTTGVALRSGAEQSSVLAGFGRWVNALPGPAQIVVSTIRWDLAPYAQAVLEGAARFDGQALRAAAGDHAQFLLRLDSDREPLRRGVLAVVAAGPQQAATVRGLTTVGITAEPLDGCCVAAALAAAVDPYDPPTPGPRAPADVPVTARPTATVTGPTAAASVIPQQVSGVTALAGTGLDRWLP